MAQFLPIRSKTLPIEAFLYKNKCGFPSNFMLGLLWRTSGSSTIALFAVCSIMSWITAIQSHPISPIHHQSTSIKSVNVTLQITQFVLNIKIWAVMQISCKYLKRLFLLPSFNVCSKVNWLQPKWVAFMSNAQTQNVSNNMSMDRLTDRREYSYW